DSWSLRRFVTFLYVTNISFLQAEDGIRYSSVTGVQTCALPISLGPFAMFGTELRKWTKGASSPVSEADMAVNELLERRLRSATRSEERRVGKRVDRVVPRLVNKNLNGDVMHPRSREEE